MQTIRLFLEAIIAIPKLLDRIASAQEAITRARLEQENARIKDEINTHITRLERAQTDEERRIIVRDLNNIRL